MGLGLGLCCCGCATCGGILDDPTLSVLNGSQLLLAGVYDVLPVTADYGTHLKYLMRASLVYQPIYSTATVQVFSGTLTLTARVTLRLEDGSPPIVSVATTAYPHSVPPMSIDLIGGLGPYYGAIFQCDNSSSGWTMTGYQNDASRFYNLMRFEGVCVVNDVGGSRIATVPVPDSWCCPNGNNDAMGGGNCGEADEAPDTATLTIAGFVDQSYAPWATLNGDFTLTKTGEIAYADRYLGSYLSDTQTTGGCQWRYSGNIVVPRTGFPSAQCGATIVLSPVSAAATCYLTPGQVLYGLDDRVGSLGMYIYWRWSQLGCQFGHFELNSGAYFYGGSPDTAGRPTRLAW